MSDPMSGEAYPTRIPYAMAVPHVGSDVGWCMPKWVPIDKWGVHVGPDIGSHRHVAKTATLSIVSMFSLMRTRLSITYKCIQ